MYLKEVSGRILMKIGSFHNSTVQEHTEEHTENNPNSERYASPEARDQHFRQKADVWAAGVILYEMVTGNLSNDAVEYAHVERMVEEVKAFDEPLAHVLN